MDTIDSSHTDFAVCPYCGHRDRDSWELPDETIAQCGECEKEYRVYRNTYCTYTSQKIEAAK